MPATSPEALARRRERAAEWRAERRADPAYRERENVKRRSGKPRPPAKPKWRRVLDAPFVGCDGEATTDPVTGAHDYCLFRMGDRELFKGGRRLTTPELLQFIVDHPDPRDYLVGFFFGYDCNSIMQDIQIRRDPARPDIPSRLERLLALDIADWKREPAPNKSGYWTWFNFDGFPEFGVNWLDGNHIKVCYGMPDPEKPGRRKSVPGSIRTIEDVARDFQGSFVKALETWGVGSPAVVAEIAATKDQREFFTEITPEIRRYNALECSLLAELMEKFRATTVQTGPIPKTWNGAGKLGAALHRANGTIKREDYEARFPAGLRQMARDAYYGHRFEITRTGLIDEKVYALDINSAFPAGMLTLPCLHHGRFRKASAATLKASRSALYVCPVRFTHPREQFLCGFPVRSRKGPISWPREGSGVYWSTEIRAAKRLGAKVELLGGWLYQKRCKCKPFDWVRAAYVERQKLDKQGKGRGIPLKLALNSSYGKIAQRVGARTWANHVHGGLITAQERCQIIDAIVSAGQRNVVMIAADGLFTIKRRPAVPISKRLGEWGADTYSDLFIVQPGLYWPNGEEPKTRGISRKFFAPYVESFEHAWSDYAQDVLLWGYRKPPPMLGVPVKPFISLRLAMRLNDLSLAARWKNTVRKISFGWQNKRCFERLSDDSLSAILGPIEGNRDAWSFTYDEQGKRVAVTIDLDGGVRDGEVLPSDMRALFEAMPDPVDFGQPFED